MQYRIIFRRFEQLAKMRDASEFVYYYDLTDCKYVGKPEENSKTLRSKIKVSVSGRLEASWHAYGLSWTHLYRVLFEYGKRHIIEKLKDGTLSQYEELDLLSKNTPSPCEFDPSTIPEPENYSLEVEIPEVKLTDVITFKTEPEKTYYRILTKNEKIVMLGDNIIVKRDYINAIFKEKYKDDLLYLSQERTLMDLYRDATTHDEFVSRIASISSLVTNIKTSKLTEIVNKELKGSLNYLEEFLKIINADYIEPITILRNINNLRKVYPIHGDNIPEVIKSHKFFDFEYPLKDYSNAILKVKYRYLSALEKLYNVLYAHCFKQNGT